MCRTHFQIFLPNLSWQFTLNVQTQMVGSEAQGAAYSTGYHQTVVQASIHLLSLQSLSHPLFNWFLFDLKSLSLEPLGPKFRILYHCSPSLFQLCACSLLIDCPLVVVVVLFSSGS